MNCSVLIKLMCNLLLFSTAFKFLTSPSVCAKKWFITYGNDSMMSTDILSQLLDHWIWQRQESDGK